MESGSLQFLTATDFDASDTTSAIEISGCNFRNPNSDASLDCLRTLTWEQLLNVQLTVATADAPFVDGFFAFSPTVDGDFVGGPIFLVFQRPYQR
jgi:hypothetical protein